VTALAIVCAALAAAGARTSAAGARSAAALVPARLDAAVLIDGAKGAAGLRAFLDGVAQRAPALAAGPRLAALVGPDLLGEPVSWGLASSGPRAVLLAQGTVALTAPVREAKAARTALQSWLEQLGPARRLRRTPLRGLLASGSGNSTRAGMVGPLAGELRLLTASGPQAPALVATLARIGVAKAAEVSLSADRSLSAAIARLTGPAALVARGHDPLRAAALSLEASAQGLVASGLLLAPAPLLAGDAPGPSSCAGAALLCLRAGLGPAGRILLAQGAGSWLAASLDPGTHAVFEPLAQRAAAAADKLVVRSDGADPRLLSSERESLRAVQLAGVTAPPPEGAAQMDSGEARGSSSACVRADAAAAWFAVPCVASAPADPRSPGGTEALEARLDLSAADSALQKLTPFDALRGSVPATLILARTMLGGLLRRSGPLQLTGKPHAAGAEVELRWPLK
jgi:hypothetical protein